MAPRLRSHASPLEDEPLFEDALDGSGTYIDEEPEVLPSIFSVSKEPAAAGEGDKLEARKATARMAKSKVKPKAKVVAKAKAKASAKRKAPPTKPSRAKKPRS